MQMVVSGERFNSTVRTFAFTSKLLLYICHLNLPIVDFVFRQAAVSLVQSFLTRGVIVENIVLNTALAACSKFAAAVPAMQNLLDEVRRKVRRGQNSRLAIF